MRKDEVLALLAAHREELRQLGVQSIALFGSVARDGAGPQSDVDVLVEFADRTTLDGYMDLKWYLEALLGQHVDLATPGALKPALRRRLAGELVHVA